MDKTLKEPHLLRIRMIGDDEVGYISVTDCVGEIPFDIKRVYWIYSAPSSLERGHHAHKELEQVLFALHGRIDVQLESTSGEKKEFILSDPNEGLYVPHLHWRRLRFSNEGAVLLCLASAPFNPDDYIRDYEEFIRIKP